METSELPLSRLSWASQLLIARSPSLLLTTPYHNLYFVILFLSPVFSFGEKQEIDDRTF
jgi:hypothetical protein